MGKFVYSKDFEPIVKVGEYIKTLPDNKFYQVKYIQPVQPFIVSLLPEGTSSLSAYGNSGDRVEPWKIDKLYLDDNVLGQFRIEPLDDVLVVVALEAARNKIYSMKNFYTYIQKEFPEHTVMSIISSADTETPLWVVSDLTADGLGKRSAEITRIELSNEGATDTFVRFGDGDGTGNSASSDNALFSVKVVAGDTVVLKENEIPTHDFINGVCAQISAATTMRVTVSVKESVLSPFKSNANKELYWIGENVPYFGAINPLKISQTSARILLAGYKYYITEVSPTEVFTAVPIASYMVRG